MNNPYAIIETILVTERSMDLKDANKYIFKVHEDATKIDVRHAVEKLYDVKVKSVNIINKIGKMKRAGKQMKHGRRPSVKKAIVTLSKGSIEIV
jgi:large subunit ribosomal protein L23